MKERVLWISLGVIFLIFVVLLVLLVLFRPVQTQTIPAEVRVDSAIGFKLDNDKFYFGRVRPGASAERFFNFTAPFDAVLVITSSGEAGDWIVPSQRELLVFKGESQKLRLVLTAPSTVSFGNYTADVHFTLYRPFTRSFFISSQG